jgi:hypothetical protein
MASQLSDFGSSIEPDTLPNSKRSRKKTNVVVDGEKRILGED